MRNFFHFLSVLPCYYIFKHFWGKWSGKTLIKSCEYNRTFTTNYFNRRRAFRLLIARRKRIIKRSIQSVLFSDRQISNSSNWRLRFIDPLIARRKSRDIKLSTDSITRLFLHRGKYTICGIIRSLGYIISTIRSDSKIIRVQGAFF